MQEDSLKEKGKTNIFADVLFSIAGCCVSLGIIIIILLILSYFNILQLPYTSFLPHQIAKSQQNSPTSAPLEKCSLKKEGNPLIGSIAIQGTTVLGYFEGRVTNIVYDKLQQPTSMTLQKENQSHVFNVSEERIIMTRLNSDRIKISPDIALGNTVRVFFNCIPQEGEKFTVTGISTMQ